GMINIGRLDAGTARNVVPAFAKLLAEIRTESKTDLEYLNSQFRRLVAALAGVWEVGVTIDQVGYSPPASSDASVAKVVGDVAKELGLVVFDEVDAEASDDAAAM